MTEEEQMKNRAFQAYLMLWNQTGHKSKSPEELVKVARKIATTFEKAWETK